MPNVRTAKQQMGRHPRALSDDGHLARVRAMRERDDRQQHLRGDVALERLWRTRWRWILPCRVHRGIRLPIRRERDEPGLHPANAHRRRSSVAIEWDRVVALAWQHCITIDAARKAHRIEVGDHGDQSDEGRDDHRERHQVRRRRLAKARRRAGHVAFAGARNGEQQRETEGDVDRRPDNEQQFEPEHGHENQPRDQHTGNGAKCVEPIHRSDRPLGRQQR